MTLMLLLLAIVTTLASALLLALSQERNWRLAHGTGAGRRTSLRRIGWTLAMLTLAFCTVRDGLGFGSILGLFLLAAAFAIVTLILAFRPDWLRSVTLLLADD